MKLRIATRQSPLALWQAEHVRAELLALEPALSVELEKRLTKGDKILDQALSKVGGKDLFVKEIEEALLDGQAEVAVHSLKDMPTKLPEGLSICAYAKREDPRDALVSDQGHRLDTLPPGAKVGTSSLRRAAQLLAHRPDLVIVPIRGNVQTRLRRMKEEGMDATVLAYAGLLRLELAHLATEVIPTAISMPAIGQGILGIETRTDDEATNRLVARLDDADARVSAVAERAFLHRLEGGCQVPIAAHTSFEAGELRLAGLVASLDGRTVIRGERRGARLEAASIGVALAEDLLSRGADVIMESLKHAAP